MSREECKAIQTEKMTVAELVYDIYFAIMLFAKGIGLYEGQAAYNLILVAGTLLIFIKILLTQHSVYEYIWMALLSLLSLVVYKNSGEKGLIIYTLMLIGVKGVSVKRLFAIGAVIWTGCFFIMHFLTMTGVVPDVFLIHDKLGLGYLLRWSFGYPHPNVLHISYVVMLIFLLYMVRDDKQKLRSWTIVGFLGNLYVFLFSLSYTGVILATLYLILNYYFCTRRSFTCLEKWLINLVFPVCVVFSIIGPLVIRGRLFDLIDKMINTRFSLSKYFLETQPITLLGTYMDVPNYRYTLDCSYTYAFMHYGVIPFLLICIGYVLLIRNCLKENKRKELAVILGLAIAGITEPFLFNTSYKNPAFLFMGAYLFTLSAHIVSRLPSIFGKQIQCLKVGNRSITIGSAKQEQKETVSSGFTGKERRTLIILFLAAAVIAGGIYGFTVQMPESIYVPDSIADDIDNEPDYLTQEEIDSIAEEGAWVMAYYGEQERMYRYEGTIITVEYIRGIVRTGVWTGGIVTCLAAIFLHHRKRSAII